MAVLGAEMDVDPRGPPRCLAPDHSVFRFAIMVTHGRQTVGVLPPVLGNTFYYLLSDDTTLCLFAPPRISFLMGRRTWTTPVQLEFLSSRVPELPGAKAGIGMNVLYAQIAQEFLTRWGAESFTIEAAEAVIRLEPDFNPKEEIVITPERLKALAETRLRNVRIFYFTYVFRH